MQGRLENEIKIQKKIDEILIHLPQYVSEWSLNLKASRLTSTSCKVYIEKIAKFLRYIDDNPMNVTPQNITLQAVESYMISIQTKRNTKGMIVFTSDSYQQTVWCALNSFIDFMCKRKYVTENYVEYIRRPKNNDLERINSERILLTQKDFNKIIKSIQEEEYDKQNFYGKLIYRDLAMMYLFMSTGIRETALMEINVSDIDINNQTLTIIEKGNKIRNCHLNDKMIDLLQEWMNVRCEFVKDDEDALFINYNGVRITQNGISKIVKKYTLKAIGKALSPHKLRGGFCSILYNQTHDAEFVRRAVGHSSVNTTQRYIRTNNDENEIAAQMFNNIIKL